VLWEERRRKRLNPDNGRGVGIWNAGVCEPSGAAVRPKWFYRTWRGKQHEEHAATKWHGRDEKTEVEEEHTKNWRAPVNILPMSSNSITTRYGEELQRMAVSNECKTRRMRFTIACVTVMPPERSAWWDEAWQSPFLQSNDCPNRHNSFTAVL
jgi:hypothetical protein